MLNIDRQNKVINTTDILLADLNKESSTKALRGGGYPEPSQLAVFLIDNAFKGGDLHTWIDNGIPDLAIALIDDW